MQRRWMLDLCAQMEKPPDIQYTIWKKKNNTFTASDLPAIFWLRYGDGEAAI